MVHITAYNLDLAGLISSFTAERKLLESASISIILLNTPRVTVAVFVLLCAAMTKYGGSCFRLSPSCVSHTCIY